MRGAPPPAARRRFLAAADTRSFASMDASMGASGPSYASRTNSPARAPNPGVPGVAFATLIQWQSRVESSDGRAASSQSARGSRIAPSQRHQPSTTRGRLRGGAPPPSASRASAPTESAAAGAVAAAMIAPGIGNLDRALLREKTMDVAEPLRAESESGWGSKNAHVQYHHQVEEVDLADIFGDRSQYEHLEEYSEPYIPCESESEQSEWEWP